MKYKLTETVKLNSCRMPMYQIQALRDIPSKGVKIGDLGGFIAHEQNLAHRGDCWVAIGEQVYGNSRVYGD